VGSDSLSNVAAVTDAFGSPAEIGNLFLSDHLLAFEITSIILLVAAVGGVILGSHVRWRDRHPPVPGPEPDLERVPEEVAI
jgi:hypothetical protein